MIPSRALALAGTHGPADIQEGIASGAFQEWGAGESVIVTEVLTTPRKKFLHLFLAEGNKAELCELLPVAMQWGREQGCTHASFVGRFGWLRSWAKDFGFKYVSVMMEAQL